ncbi:MAG: endonuclease/exonuclease/phosphatase family protein [Pseudomonadota bacterium]
MKRLIPTLFCPLLLAGCAKPDAPPNVDSPADVAAEVTIMTFNVENLFDTQDDEGKDDHTYLPRAVKDDPAHIALCEPLEVERWRRDCLTLDWTEEALDFKLGQIAQAILQVNDGRGPDIIAFQEVENAAVLTRLSTDYMAAAGYGDAILIEGQDLRGIDVAFLSRLPVVGSPVHHDFEASGFPDRQPDTRGVLEATFELPDGTRLTGFSVHFPAPFHPIEMRELAYDHLNALRANVPSDHFVFAAGDFNTPLREVTGTSILDDRARPFWTIAHEVDCEGCKGTNYWSRGQSWSFLDTIFFSPANAADSDWRIKTGGVFIADQYPDQLNDDGTVKRFDLGALEGVSDHLPMVMTLQAASAKQDSHAP